jgi:hypothetical protein
MWLRDKLFQKQPSDAANLSFIESWGFYLIIAPSSLLEPKLSEAVLVNDSSLDTIEKLARKMEELGFEAVFSNRITKS